MDTILIESAALVLSIECLQGSSTADEWTGGLLQTGDVVEELTFGDSPSLRSPFKKGAAGVQKILRKSYKRNETSVLVRVRRGSGESAELQACIVPNASASLTMKKKQQKYALRAIGDPNYTFGFCDRTENDCLRLQASRNSRMLMELYSVSLRDGYISYNWEKKMQETLLVPNSSCFLSILFIPQASYPLTCHYNNTEDTLSRANAWLHASQASGVPLVFMNIQTESLLTKISGESASSKVNTGPLSDMSNISSTSLYGFEDYHGVDIGVIRAFRLWYAPSGGEFGIEININDSDTKLGLSISRTEEGFIYISSVDECEDTPSGRSGLGHFYREARKSARLLVISRISNQKVLPWLVSSTGDIRCYDTVSISYKLSLHRRAKVPIVIHLFSWNDEPQAGSSSSLPPDPSQHTRDNSEHDVSSASLHRDDEAEISFRFQSISISNNR
ncbi:hypothetical protein SAY86_009183 [Trapa natans]|uniref:Uncharacterized protein n=1 Tax=Trapa natans TaxID=22666 RepID=A0AAN7QFD7_TRANT|nr:hypothetical protein SAY86_009183 [Trapa natans]